MIGEMRTVWREWSYIYKMEDIVNSCGMQLMKYVCQFRDK